MPPPPAVWLGRQIAAGFLTGAVFRLVPQARFVRTLANRQPAIAAKSNEDPSHEAGESAAQEQAEDSGQGRHFGRPNEDPSHEASESAEREAQEDAGGGSRVPGPAESAPSGVNS